MMMERLRSWSARKNEIIILKIRRVMIRFIISGRHIDLTEALKTYAEEKTSKLPKYFDSITEIEVIIDGSDAGNPIVEIIVRAFKSKPFIVTETSDDAYKSIDIAVHKLERQIRKKKEQQRDSKHIGGTDIVV
jgi:putative sigma-54 modulation protein